MHTPECMHHHTHRRPGMPDNPLDFRVPLGIPEIIRQGQDSKGFAGIMAFVVCIYYCTNLYSGWDL